MLYNQEYNKENFEDKKDDEKKFRPCCEAYRPCEPCKKCEECKKCEPCKKCEECKKCEPCKKCHDDKEDYCKCYCKCLTHKTCRFDSFRDEEEN